MYLNFQFQKATNLVRAAAFLRLGNATWLVAGELQATAPASAPSSLAFPGFPRRPLRACTNETRRVRRRDEMTKMRRKNGSFVSSRSEDVN
jgi:hypothetical protein